MLGAVLLLIAGGGALVVSSCGSGGGGDSTGDLCGQCGQTDGPCQSSVTVTGSDAADLCPADQTTCDVHLDCFRKLGSAQRRCYPIDGVDFEQFPCDGERARRATPTPTPTRTLTPTATPTPTATGLTPTPTTGLTPTATTTAAALCGNGVIDGDEECDGANVDSNACSDLCDIDDTGMLSCNANCTFDFSHCEFPGTCSP